MSKRSLTAVQTWFPEVSCFLIAIFIVNLIASMNLLNIIRAGNVFSLMAKFRPEKNYSSFYLTLFFKKPTFFQQSKFYFCYWILGYSDKTFRYNIKIHAKVLSSFSSDFLLTLVAVFFHLVLHVDEFRFLHRGTTFVTTYALQMKRKLGNVTLLG